MVIYPILSQLIDHAEAGIGLSLLISYQRNDDTELMSYTFADNILHELFGSSMNQDILPQLPLEVDFTEKDGVVVEVKRNVEVQQAKGKSQNASTRSKKEKSK